MKTETKDELRAKVVRLEIENKTLQKQTSAKVYDRVLAMVKAGAVRNLPRKRRMDR